MMIVVMVMVYDATGDRPPDERHAHDGHEDAGQNPEPELDLRPETRMCLLVQIDDDAHDDDERGVRDRDDDRQQHGVPVGAALTDQIGGHDGLGVTGH